MYRHFIKRLIDITASLGVIILVLPLFLLMGIIVKLDSKESFFFKQERLGKDVHVFEVYKIRTMYDRFRVADREILKGDFEVTPIGEVLQRFKIDELPQIINIFKASGCIEY